MALNDPILWHSKQNPSKRKNKVFQVMLPVVRHDSGVAFRLILLTVWSSHQVVSSCCLKILSYTTSCTSHCSQKDISCHTSSININASLYAPMLLSMPGCFNVKETLRRSGVRLAQLVCQPWIVSILPQRHFKAAHAAMIMIIVHDCSIVD